MDEIMKISVTVLGIGMLAFAGLLLVVTGLLLVQFARILRSPACKKSLRSLLFVPGAGGDMSQVWAEQRRQALAQDQQFQQGVSYRGLHFITGGSGTGSEGNSGPGFTGPDMGGGFGGGGFDQGF